MRILAIFVLTIASVLALPKPAHKPLKVDTPAHLGSSRKMDTPDDIVPEVVAPPPPPPPPPPPIKWVAPPTAPPTVLSADCVPVKFGTKAQTSGVFFSPHFHEGVHMLKGQSFPAGKPTLTAGKFCRCGACANAFKAAGGCRLWAKSLLRGHTVTEDSKIFDVIPAGCYQCEDEAARECGINGLGYKPKKSHFVTVKHQQLAKSHVGLAKTEGQHEPKGKGEGESQTHETEEDASALAGPTVGYDPKVYPVDTPMPKDPVVGEIYHGRKYYKSTLGKVESTLEPKGKADSEGDLDENGQEDSYKGAAASVVEDPKVAPVATASGH